METPDSIKTISENFVDNSWKNYTIAELGQWIYLLIKRANLETNKLKASNDIMLAQNYLNMIQLHIDAAFLGLDDRYKNYIMRLFQLKKDEIEKKDNDGAISPECLESLDIMFGVRATDSHIDEMDLTVCPNCGGYSDNGHDRRVPPNPYLCSECEKIENSSSSGI